MPSFISRAACRGRRPSQFASFDGHQRPALIARMLKERTVARFLVAPDGYGKTAVALEYAETIFSWAHAYWINGKSPCFIRDLDAKVVASECIANDAEVALVVIDDLPLLDVERAKLFSDEIDRLLAHRCEVIVTCAPANDAPGQFQRDRICLQAGDLLLDDDELDERRPPDERMRVKASSVPPARRVPALVWGDAVESPQRFAAGVLGEELPCDLLRGMCTVLVLQKGSFEDLLEMGASEKGLFAEIAADYPHLGFDAGLDGFSASPLSIAALAGPVRRLLEDLTAGSAFDSCEDLVKAWARLLVANGLPGRACDLMRLVCPRSSRAQWAIDRAGELVSQVSFLPLLRLVRDQADAKGEVRQHLMALEALCCRVLGAPREAVTAARRSGFAPSSPEAARTCCLLVMAGDDDGAVAGEAFAELEEEAQAARERRAEGLAVSPWMQLAEAWCAGERGAGALAELWGLLREQAARREVLCICASRLFALAGREVEGGADPVAASRLIDPAERYVRELLSEGDASHLDYFCASAGLSLEQARQRGIRSDAGPLGAAAMIALRQVEMNLVMQRRQLEDEQRGLAVRRGDWQATHPEALAASRDLPVAVKRTSSVPVLTLKLFGKFEVSIGDEPIDPRRMRRQNLRSLLVLLAVNQGKEVSRDSMAKVMWPHSTEEMARKNFYSVWAQLRRLLTLADGTCPYLVRHQFGCSLESRYVQSDAARLSEICRELLFGAPNLEQWSLLFAEIDRDFSSDLMPGEQKNMLVVQARNEYRSRLIDALVAATFSVIDIGNPKWGIWFARSAISHDETREDAYVALMRAQIASDQRTAAMMTFLKCRRALSDQLGIDPSPETTALYESLLNT